MSGDASPPVDWHSLNSEFYSGDPAAYFRYRLNLLMLIAGRPDEVERLLVDGVRYQGLVSMSLDRSTEEVGDAHLAYLITESQALLHHTSEALLRLFLAHAEMPPCPWFEVASLRNFARFKQRASELGKTQWPEGLERAIWTIFLGGRPDDPTVEQAAGHGAIRRLMQHLASALLDDSNLYNSVKHGMAVVAAETYFGITSEDTGSGVGHQGTSVAFLESTDDDSTRTWKVTRRWVSVRRALWLSQMAMCEIDALWAVARRRYLDADLSGVQAVTAEAVEDGITGAFADRGGITSFSRTVAVEDLSR